MSKTSASGPETSTTGARGTTPAGAPDEQAAARAVQQMFDEIAPRYDLANHTLSLNIDRLWWRRTARTFSRILQRTDARVLDLCAGTGDMSVALRSTADRAGSLPEILALDFSHRMLVFGRQKYAQRNIQSLEADALNLPLPDSAVDLVVSAFGFRNLANYDAGLLEIYRVLKSGGEVGILDFGEPRGAMGKLYGFYFRHVLPRIGTFISGVRGPYEYLPESVKKFPSPEQMSNRMGNIGFTEVSWTPYTFGIAGLYRGRKP